VARLERNGDRTELVTEDGVRLPWALGEKPEYGLTLPPLGPDLRTAENAHVPQGRGETRSDFDPRAAVEAADEAGQKRDTAALTSYLTRGQAAPAHQAQGRPKEQGLRPDQAFHKVESDKQPGGLRGGAREIDMPDVEAEGAELASPRGSPVQRIPGGLRLKSQSITRGVGEEGLSRVKQAGERSSISNRESLAAAGAAEYANREADHDELALQAQGLSEQVRTGREKLAAAALQIDADKAELDNEREKLQNLETDPHHYWASKNAGTKILAAIGMLGGGLLAGIHGGENQFMKFAQQVMADDKAERMNKIKARQAGHKIRLGEWDKKREKLGSDLAEIETEGRQLGTISAQLRKYAKTVGPTNAALAAKVNAQADEMDAEKLLKYGMVDSQYGDRIVDTIENERDQFVGGAPKTDESDLRALSAARAGQGLGASEAEAGNLRDLISEIPEGDVIETFESKDAARRFGRTLTDSVFGRGTSAQWYDSKAERGAQAKLGRARSAIISRLSGANVPPQEYERLAEGINEANTREGLERFANEVERSIQRKDAAVKAGFKPEVVETYEDRQRRLTPRDRPKSSRDE